MKIILSTNADKFVSGFDKDSEQIKRAMKFAMFRALSIMDAEIKQNIRSRSGLNVRTGTLLNSIQQRISSNGDTVTGEIGPQNVPYAAIHEYGGTIPARFVRPVRRKALRFFGSNGAAIFSKGHTIPATTIPKRPYLAPAVTASADRIAETFAIFIEEALVFNK